MITSQKFIRSLIILTFLLFSIIICESDIFIDLRPGFTLFYQDSSVTIYHYKDVTIDKFYSQEMIDDLNYYYSKIDSGNN